MQMICISLIRWLEMDELAKRFADIAAQYAPQVADAAKQSVIISCYSTMLYATIWIIIGLVLIKASTIFWFNRTNENLAELPAGILMLLGVGAVIISVLCWIDPWLWVALYRPELYIAHSFLKL
jgi:hypothetical protein